ncbi:MAG: D-alanyl-D-alanine carboxypeptidase/D-alanyl-D-alanine endopeptidase [Candidatus Nanopelagicales bacterium]
MQQRLLPVASVTLLLSLGLLVSSGPATAEASDPVLTPTAISGSTAPMPTTAGLAAKLEPLLDSRTLGESAAIVLDPATGETLFARSATKAFVPASTAKLLTAAAALSVLGPSTRLATRVLSDGATVTLVGGGDATLVSGTKPRSAASLTDLAKKTAAALPANASVAVDYDASLFSGPEYAAGWSRGWARSGVVAPVSALMSDEGRAARNSIARSEDPARTAARQFVALLTLDGVTARLGSAGPAAMGAEEIARVESPTVSMLVQQMLTDSNNDLAESLAHLVGLKSTGKATFKTGASATIAAVSELGIPTDDVALVDGSGLSHRDRIPPLTLASLLSATAGDQAETLWPIASGLPVAGLTGTLADRFDAKAMKQAVGYVRAKTGSLSDTVALAGSVRDRDGRVLTFAVLANKIPSVGAARATVDKIANQLAKCGCR